MKLSLGWLREFVDLGGRSAEEIAQVLTMRTALIEGIEWRGRGIEGVVVGKVLAKAKHPNADRLNVCTVGIGAETFEIVCGAPNVDAGQTVFVAQVGAVLPGDFRIKRSKIRGVESNGMICSSKELGLGEDHDGILVLEDELASGTALSDVPGVVDAIFEIDNKSITHRPDLWCHEGFARELAAIYGIEFRPATTATEPRPGDAGVRVVLEADDLCGKYHALMLRGSLGGPAPALVRRRLEACGLRSISLGVDLTNYVMLEIGQPTHLFDARHVGGGTIRVRRSTAGERLRTLDDVDRELPADTCVIADATRALAIGGIMGGVESGTRADTTEAILEAAWFEPVRLRRTSTGLGLRTDALARFEKHLDPGLAERGMRRFVALLARFAPAISAAPTYTVAGSRAQGVLRLQVRPERVRSRLGVATSVESMIDPLQRLGFRVTVQGDQLAIDVPTWRATRDVLGEDDVVEEVGRMIGYDTIAPVLPHVVCAPVTLEPSLVAWRAASATLRERFGFAEVLSHATADDQQWARAGMSETAPAVRLKNPLQQNAARLRRSLAPALLEFVDRNIRTVEHVRMFECGRVFVPELGDGEIPAQPLALCAVVADRVTRKGEGGLLLRQLKGMLEDLARVWTATLRFEAGIGVDARGFAHPSRCARIVDERGEFGFIAQVRPDVADRFGWRGEVAIFEIDVDRAVESVSRASTYVPLARFPDVKVDLSFITDFELDFARIEREWRAASTLLADVELVDEYVAPPIPAGKRSLTMRLRFRAVDKTLTDAEVGVEIEKLKTWLAAQGAQLRA
ncbi:MAG: phenylalanine--tRNA ligase subunit beta [Planctomycetes bacterium]|nr:phenylalanine--tRNA ligase subunit beta [Planctomycetota bacterium]MCC7169759.1 phenylalanine--tRNA ligase subunit beta [Planctomycetota bacterium]